MTNFGLGFLLGMIAGIGLCALVAIGFYLDWRWKRDDHFTQTGERK